MVRPETGAPNAAIRRRLTAGLAVVVLAVTACSGRPAEPTAGVPCAAENQRYCAAVEGDLLDITLDVLHPTQPSLGYDEVFYRLGRYTLGEDAGTQLFDAWCVANGQKALQSAKPGATIRDRSTFTCTVPVGCQPAITRLAALNCTIRAPPIGSE